MIAATCRLLVLLAVLLPFSSCDIFNYDVEHSFDGKSFSSAGNIFANAEQQALKYVRPSWTAKQKKQFQDLLERDGFYTLRLSPSRGPPPAWLSSSVRARCLQSPSMREEVQLHMDDAYRILAFQYALHNATACSGQSVPSVFDLYGEPQQEGPAVPELRQEVGVSVHFAQPAVGVIVMEGTEQGMPRETRPDPAGGRVKKEGGEEGEEDSKAPAKDERTWLQKNWLFCMVAVMMVLQVVLKAAGDPEGPPRPAGAGAAATGAAPAGGGRRTAGSGRRG